MWSHSGSVMELLFPRHRLAHLEISDSRKLEISVVLGNRGGIELQDRLCFGLSGAPLLIHNKLALHSFMTKAASMAAPKQIRTRRLRQEFNGRRFSSLELHASLRRNKS